MSKVTTLTRKGQVTIPKEVRDKLGLKPFDKIEMRVEDGEARLRKARPSLDELAGSLPSLGLSIDEMIALAKEERAKRTAQSLK